MVAARAVTEHMMHFEQSIDLALSDHIGRSGVTRENYAGALIRTAEAIDWLNARHADGGLPLLQLPGTTDDLASIQEIARQISDLEPTIEPPSKPHREVSSRWLRPPGWNGTR